jgi:tetratricopeptide (TPR) repeat protein
MQKTLIIPWLCGFLFCAILGGCAFLPSGRPLSYPSIPDSYSGQAAYYYSLSVLSRLDGDLTGAIEQLKQALAIHPDSPYLTTELVSLYVENNNADLALPLGESALAKNPGNSELRSIMGGLYFNLHEYDKAIREYQTIIDLDPQNPVAYLYLATIYAQEKKYDSAERAYKKLLEIDSDNIIGMYYYARTLVQMERPAEAEALFQKITVQGPEFEAAWLGLAALYEDQKKYDEAIGVYRSYLEINPARIGFRMKIAELLVKTNQEARAEKEFQEILKMSPANREVRTALGLLFYDMRRFDAAAAQFSLLLEKTPADDKLNYLLANALEQKGDLGAARAAYQKVSPGFELYASAQVHAAMILKKEGKLDDAIGLITRSIQKKADQALQYLYLSSLYEEKKDLAAAEKTVVEGMARFPRNADLHYVLGSILEKTNRFEESIKSMEKVLDIDPQNADALNFIGYSYADRGMNLDAAEQMILQALKIKPDNGYILDSLGWVYFKKDQYDSALQHIRRALDLQPNDANIMEHLGDVYLKIGRDKEALDYYRKAEKIDPDNGALKKKIDNLLNKK